MNHFEGRNKENYNSEIVRRTIIHGGYTLMNNSKMLIGVFIGLLIEMTIITIINKSSQTILSNISVGFYLVPAFILSVFVILFFIGNPILVNRVYQLFSANGFTNHLSKPPTLLEKRMHEDGYKYLFLSEGISFEEWHEKKSDIENALNEHVIKIERGASFHKIIIHTKKYVGGLPDFIHWKDVFFDE